MYIITNIPYSYPYRTEMIVDKKKKLETRNKKKKTGYISFFFGIITHIKDNNYFTNALSRIIRPLKQNYAIFPIFPKPPPSPFCSYSSSSSYYYYFFFFWISKCIRVSVSLVLYLCVWYI